MMHLEGFGLTRVGDKLLGSLTAKHGDIEIKHILTPVECIYLEKVIVDLIKKKLNTETTND